MKNIKFLITKYYFFGLIFLFVFYAIIGEIPSWYTIERDWIEWTTSIIAIPIIGILISKYLTEKITKERRKYYRNREKKYSMREKKYSMREKKYSMRKKKYSMREKKYSMREKKCSMREKNYSYRRNKYY